MSQQIQGCFQEENSWFDCIGDLEQKNKRSNLSKIVKFETEIMRQECNSISSSEPFRQKFIKKNDSKNNERVQNFKRKRDKVQIEEQYFTSNSSSNEIKQKNSDSREECDGDEKNGKQAKQHIYSKNYRQRKKQNVKLLQEQNEYLKKKVQQLQFRLRQMELEMNRIKYMPEEKEFTIDQLNQQFMTKVTVIMEKNKENPAEYRDKYSPSDEFYHQFMKTYAKHGFGGTMKLQVMNYYFNEIMEAMLRDSEKYFAIICTKAKDGDSIEGLPRYEPINNIFWDILQPDEDKLRRLQYFNRNLHPMVLEFVDGCKQFYLKFNRIKTTIQKIHQFMKITYPSNFDFARKRIIDLESWFNLHKYSKMMRNLRSDWLQMIKSENSDQEKRNCNGNKKKKSNHKQEQKV